MLCETGIGLYSFCPEAEMDMEIRIVPECCMALEAAEVIGRKVNGEDYQQTRDKFLMRYGNRFDQEEKEKFLRKMELIEKVYERIYEQIPEDDMTKFLFRKYYYENTYSSLAQIFLINFQDITACSVDAYIEACVKRCKETMESHQHLRAVAFSALVLETGEQPLVTCLLADLDKLEYPYEFKWNLVKVLTNYEFYLEELKKILQKIEKELAEALQMTDAYAEEMKKFWQMQLSDRMMEDFAASMGLQAENVAGKEVVLQVLRMPCDQALLDDQWGTDTLLLCLGLCVEWGSQFSAEEVDKSLLCEELRAFGEESKFEILQLLTEEGAYGKEIAKKVGLDAATVSRHLSVLQKCGLIYMERKEGRNVYFRTNQGEIRNLLELLHNIFSVC